MESRYLSDVATSKSYSSTRTEEIRLCPDWQTCNEFRRQGVAKGLGLTDIAILIEIVLQPLPQLKAAVGGEALDPYLVQNTTAFQTGRVDGKSNCTWHCSSGQLLD
jgi:hypothetical protein